MEQVNSGNYLCTKCQGAGKVELSTESWLPGGGSRTVVCDICNGKGFIVTNTKI
jgi:DnaJ-class molecular chaperone